MKSKIPEKEIQKNAIEYTNAKKYEDALTMIDDAIILIPSNPAGYNDKAQILSVGLFSHNFYTYLLSHQGSVAG